jgi:hypothetical protein
MRSSHSEFFFFQTLKIQPELPNHSETTVATAPSWFGSTKVFCSEEAKANKKKNHQS